MAVTVTDFLETANDEQRRVWYEIMQLTREERAYHDAYMERQRAIERKVSSIRAEHGLQSDLIEADLELFVEHMLPERDLYWNKFVELNTKVKELFRSAVYEHGMNLLGFFQRNYERVVGEPLPTDPNQPELNFTS